MKFKKTSYSKRSTYKHYDDEGHLVAEYKANESGFTEELITTLHKMDDHEVYVNCKEIKHPEWFHPIYEKWKADYIVRFKREHGYEPKPEDIPGRHRMCESIDAQSGGEDDENLRDSSKLEQELSFSMDKAETAVDRAREIVSSMPEQYQQVYGLVFIKGMSKAKAGRELGISDVRVGQIVRKITDKLASDKGLKKYFH